MMQQKRRTDGSSGPDSDLVLVVDDSRADLRVMEEALKPLGLSIRESTDAYGAIANLYEAEFAVALIDVRMPGLDGFDLAAEIRRHPRASGLPILFVTGDELDREEIRRAYALKAVDVIAKPFAPEVLRAKVSVFVELERRRRAAELRREVEELVLATARSAQQPVRMVNHLLRELHRALVDREGSPGALLQSLRGQAERADRLVGGLLQFASLRLDPAATEDLDPSVPIVRAARRVQGDLDEVFGEIEVREIPRVHAHPDQVCDLMRELFDNAIKFRRGEPPRIRVSGRSLPGETLISVEDNGIGIPPERAERVFELLRPLHTLPRSGTGSGLGLDMGMGLALAQRIVHLNGGRIWCEPGPDGVGTRVCFTLPEAADGDA